jgi:hypothetical protein
VVCTGDGDEEGEPMTAGEKRAVERLAQEVVERLDAVWGEFLEDQARADPTGTPPLRVVSTLLIGLRWFVVEALGMTLALMPTEEARDRLLDEWCAAVPRAVREADRHRGDEARG